MPRRPNILWICTDQQRWDTLGSAGNSWTRTPHLDALAESGAVFDAAYAQSPVCTPSRASFLTGRYPRTTGARQNGQSLPENEVLVTRTLADSGYVCGLAGKLHLSAAHWSVSPGTEPRGRDGYSEFHWSHHPDPDWPTNEYVHWLRERGAVYDTPFLDGSRHVMRGMPESQHQTTWCAEKAVDFIDAHQGFENPWLFSVNIFDPHHPFDPPEEYLRRYLDRLDEIPLPDYRPGELDDKPVFQRTDHAGAYGGNEDFHYPEMTDHDHRLIRAAYWAMCDLIDVQVGRMLDALDRTGQRDDTIVVFSTDHGEMLGDNGIYLKGPYFYDAAVRVPLIVSCPDRVRPGLREGGLVELVDLAPTLLDAAGLPKGPGMQGRSLWPLLTGAADPEPLREDVYCEYYNAMPWHPDPAPQATMIRTADHKLVAFHGLDTGELYDLRADPGEHVNLWNSAEHTAVKAGLLVRLADRMAWTVDPLPGRTAKF
ncbi:sulfatase-like hydrolase/transferase [Streptomyces olivaceus]|uniref:sulfatase family protein n=1 Tax=Streptomyces olivaceus TaxID=47716 RepID=UPI001CCC885E|nr:sulfatase-like hydrolase/transferase [Streptomyces olivaceus]MBZ6086213.1 sulfatase-like hydrolase/transferase [Streptomyces olivaceus]